MSFIKVETPGTTESDDELGQQHHTFIVTCYTFSCPYRQEVICVGVDVWSQTTGNAIYYSPNDTRLDRVLGHTPSLTKDSTSDTSHSRTQTRQ